MGLDMTWVIKMKTITFLKSIGLVITSTDHDDIDSKQILSACHTWSWWAKNALVTTTFDHMAHSPDLGLTPYHGPLALIALQHEAADIAWRNQSIKFHLGIWTTHAHWCLDLSHSCVYQFLWFYFTLPSDVKLYQLVLLPMPFMAHQYWHMWFLCFMAASNSLFYLSQFHPQYDNKLFTFALTGCITHCECFTWFALYGLHFVFQLSVLPLAWH